MSVNFKDSIEKAAQGEPILGIVISDPDSWYADEARVPFTSYGSNEQEWAVASDEVDRVLSWKKAVPMLDKFYDNGYGGQDCPSIYAWTKSRVLVVSHYDGSTSIAVVPRNPTDGKAESIGGG